MWRGLTPDPDNLGREPDSPNPRHTPDPPIQQEHEMSQQEFQHDGSWLFIPEEVPTDEEWAAENGLLYTPEPESETPPMITERIIPLTDDRGRLLVPDEDATEPLPGSVVLTEGLHGTAWQRSFADGLWCCAMGSRKVEWAYLIKRRNLVLVYDATKRVS